MGIEPTRMLLGLGDLYLNNTRVGNLKGDVVFTATKEIVNGEAGDSKGIVKRVPVGDSCVLTASICDFKLSQLKDALGIQEAIATAATIRRNDLVTMGASASPVNLPKTGITAATEKVYSADYSTIYASGTDYTTNPVAGTITPVTLVSGTQYRVIYDYVDASASVFKVGGSDALVEVPLKFMHKRNGKYVGITIHKASMTNEVALPFHEKDFTVYNVSFTGVLDTTRASGDQLYQVIEEN